MADGQQVLPHRGRGREDARRSGVPEADDHHLAVSAPRHQDARALAEGLEFTSLPFGAAFSLAASLVRIYRMYISALHITLLSVKTLVNLFRIPFEYPLNYHTLYRVRQIRNQFIRRLSSATTHSLLINTCYTDSLRMSSHLSANSAVLLSQYSLLVSGVTFVYSDACVFDFFFQNDGTNELSMNFFILMNSAKFSEVQ